MHSQKNVQEKIYCSLDIETSGFDPLKNEILEVGLAFFTVTDKGLRITEEWTRVCKPQQEVPSNILALTGISQNELDRAQPFEGIAQELQQKLEHAVIVGHNVVFDINFLESQGIRFTGRTIDTLDMVQFLLPTHHSYNLENLMHLFGVSHKDAHRALADAKACLVVLEKLLGIFAGFPKSLQKEIVAFSTRAGFEFTSLFETNVKPYVGKAAQKPAKNEAYAQLRLQSHSIYNFPLGKDCLEALVQSLSRQKQKVLLVLPKMSQVLKFYRQGQVAGWFPKESLFHEADFVKFSKKKTLTAEETKFILKLLVWRQTNWQTKTVSDLNLTFFGGQFKGAITGGRQQVPHTPNVLATDLQTFFQLQGDEPSAGRFLVIAGLNEFEQQLSASESVKASWSYVTYLLKSYYNPETASGQERYKSVVEEGLLKADLFFGLVHTLLQSGQPFEYYKVDSEAAETQVFKKLKAAAEHFTDFVREAAETLQSEELKNFAENLIKFFEVNENFVRWIELSDMRCVFYSTPVDLQPVARQKLAAFKEVAFADSLGNNKLVGYFVQRLGLEDFRVISPEQSAGAQTQGELFGKLAKKLTPKFTRTVVCKIRTGFIGKDELSAIVENSKMPAAVLFGNQTQVRDFYEENYQKLQKKAVLVAQNSSGGSNKIFHNFAIHGNSLLLATGKFVLKHLAGSSSISPVERLAVKTLIVCHLPFDHYTHPYQQAVSSRFENPFQDYSLPKAIYNFHALLQFFNTKELESIYICDSKLAKEYGKAFTEYIGQIPQIKIA